MSASGNSPNGFSSLINLAASERVEAVLSGPLSTVVSAMSKASSSLARVHRETACEWPLKLNEEVVHTKDIVSGDFLGPMFLIIQAPAIVNMCQQKVTAAGVADAAQTYRAIVPSDADRPGTFSTAVATYMLKENLNDGNVAITYSNGSSFAAEQNAADDYAAYYPDYAPAQLIKSARIMLNGSTTLFEATGDFVVVNNEMHSTTSCMYYEDLNHVNPAFRGTDNKSLDLEIIKELKLRALEPQTWIIKLPFDFSSSLTSAFPRTLLRTSSVNEAGELTFVDNTLTLEVTFNPLNSIICNGSNVGTASTITAGSGAVGVNTVTLNDSRGSGSSTFAANVDGRLLSDFKVERFRSSLLLTEIYLDVETLAGFHALRDQPGGVRMLVKQIKTLPVVSGDSTSAPLTIDLSSLSAPVTSLYWFYRLGRDTYRNMWYRMRGMTDQVTGRSLKAITSSELVVGGQAYASRSFVLFDRIMPAEHAVQRPENKDIYMYNFAAENHSGGNAPSSSSAVAVGAMNFDALRNSELSTSYLQVWVDPAIFANNSGTGGINATANYGLKPSISVHTLAVATYVLSFTPEGITLLPPASASV